MYVLCRESYYYRIYQVSFSEVTRLVMAEGFASKGTDVSAIWHKKKSTAHWLHNFSNKIRFGTSTVRRPFEFDSI